MSDRPWIQSGAAVHVSIIGFDGGEERTRNLDGAYVQTIHPNLTGTFDLTVAVPLPENAGIAFKGPSPGGKFDISDEAAQTFLAAKGNPNGRPNSDVLKRVVNAADILQRSRNYWTIDFGPQAKEEDAALYEAPFEYVKQRNYEAKITEGKMPRQKWWLYERPRLDLRKALAGLTRYIATPRTAKHRIFVWVPADVMANDATVVIARDDDYSFGVLHSRAHELWARGMGTQLREAESGFRYTSTTTFATFPSPKPTIEQQAEISAVARRLDELRRNWLDPEGTSEAELKKRTLTNLYNARPTWLANAHAELDKAVFEAYGWPKDISDEDILKNLLALNLERSGDRASA